MKKKLILLLSFVLLGMLTFLGSNTKTTSIASYLNNFQNPWFPDFGEGDGNGNGDSTTTFDHIDIESAASFTYYVDGEKQTVNINFYEDQTNLSKINIYKKNQDGTLTEIPVTGKWQNQQGTEGENSTNKEYRISGTFDIYYDAKAEEKEEVIYVVKFTLSVTIGGVEQDLVYTEEYSYNSSNNVCPGKTSGNDQGIDVLISGTKLEEYFSSSLKIVKNVQNAEDATFTFNVKAKNSSINYDKDIQITTSNKTGFVTLGGLKAGEEYIVTEINIPDGYELVTEGPITITAEQNKTITVTFTNRATTVDVTGTKTWKDNNDQDGKRPESITVNLLRNGTKIDSTTVSADADGNWTYAFNDLPEYVDGKKVTYTIEEVAVEGYTTTYNGNDITNTHAIEKTEVSGTKTWVDNNNQDGKRPVSITVNLLANGTKVDSKVVTSSDNWTYNFTNLDKYADGEEITYTVEEVAVEGYTTTYNGNDITNTHAIEKTEVSGTKTWVDNNNQDGKRPDSITINLIKDEKVIQTTTATEKSNWEYSFTNLDKYENGKEITYTVEEVAVEGYTTTYNGNDITNTHAIEKTEVSGTKTWVDNNDQDGKRPDSITINLIKDEKVIQTTTATEKSNWKYSFTNLDKYENGEEITYTVEEVAVKGYTTTYNGYNITNTHAIEKTEVSGTKTWVDNNDQDGKRPDSITINLIKDEKVIQTTTATEKSNWEYSFTNLDKYENGEKITYTVEEVAVKGYTTTYKGYNITNTHAIEKTKVSGTKTWIDNNNQDGIRPTEITVNLFANGTKVASKVVKSTDDWKYTFDNLDKYANKVEIKYTVAEDTVEGYTTEVKGYDITNTHAIEKTEVSGTKTWVDNNNQDGLRPETITVNLLKNGTKIDSKTVSADSKGNWTYTFDNLDKYEKGSKIEYKITEEKVEEYTTTYNGYNIVNTHETETITVSGTKTWVDNANQDGKRPESITVNLFANGEKIESKAIKADSKGNWTYTFENLDKYANGTEIKYTVTEDTVAGYTTEVKGYDITNTHTPEKTEVSGTKTWEDNNNQDGKRPESITINLFANGEKVTSKTISADSKGNWTYKFENLDKYANGELIEYTVTENTVEGYTPKVNGYNITNTHETEKTEVSGTKTWDDNNNQDGKRPETITVNLFANGEKVTSKTVKADTNGNWTYAFDNLDKYANGELIDYTITEDAVEGYTTEVNGYNITNTHTPETTEVLGKKIWNDNNDQDGLRPESITVNLFANGKKVETANITAGENGDWTYAFINLPKYKNGEVIKYTVSENAVEEYTTTYDETNPYIIINTHQTKKVEVSGTKTWDDNNNQDGKRPETITVRLHANGEEIDSKVVSADAEGNWTYTFANLDMYKEGQLIGYTITEDAVENYSTTINGYNITNSHTLEKISINGVKTWDDNNDQDGKRPESITINLVKDNIVIATTTATEESNWEYSFENLDKYENGQEIEYSLTEETVDGYVTNIDGYDITNTHEIEKITFQTTKIWDDNENQDGIRPTEINVKLYKNGELLNTVTITEEDNWTYIFENLDRYENGEEVIYTIEEDIVLGYNTEINYDDIDENNIITSTIVNTHTPEKIEIDINKTWNDYNDISNIRPENISVELYANGELVKTIIVTNQENWKYTITDLDKYANGQEILYTIKEKEVAGYTTTYNGFNIINTHEYGKGGDIEELPPQTGVDYINTTTNNPNIIIYLLTALLSMWIIGLKKFV